MRSNIWTLVSGRNESSSRRNTPVMYWMTLAVILLGSTCLADEDSGNKEAYIMKQAEDNIRWLRQVKEQVEREQREKNSLATLTDLMLKDSFDSQLMSKIDILYDNQTDLNKELKFVPQVFNCGKEFDIFKVLELAKAHKNITTESPPCIVDTEENMCTTKKANGGNTNGNKTTNEGYNNANKTIKTVSQFISLSALSTRMPMGQQPVEKRTMAAVVRQPSTNPQTKTIKLKLQNKEKLSPQDKEVGGKISTNPLQKQFVPKVLINKPVMGEPSLDDVRLEENPPILEDKPQRWYPAQMEQKTPPESLQQVKSVQSPLIETVPQQTQAIEQSISFQAVKQPQVQNVVIDEMAHQKLPDLEKTQSEVSEFGEQAEQGDQRSFIYAKKKQDLEKKRSEITQTQQLSHQVNKLVNQAAIQQSPTQSQVAEQQIQYSEKRAQQQAQSLEKQNQQQPQSLEKQNQQQTQSLEKQNQPQILEKPNQQQFQILEKQNQQSFQVLEKQNQQQLQTAEPLNHQQQFRNMEKHNPQVQTSEKQNQLQFQMIEKQSLSTMAAVTDLERQHSVMAVVSGSEQQQSAQKISHNITDEQQILKQQTLFIPRIEQNQQTANPSANFIFGTPAQQAQLPDPQPVAKSPSEAPNKAFTEGSGDKLSNSNSDKTMLSAPINVMVMEPNQNSTDGNPTSKVNLVPGNIPATAYFWSYTMAHTPKIQNSDSLKTDQNKVASVANKLESSDMPGNIQENPNGDYLYYPDQD